MKASLFFCGMYIDFVEKICNFLMRFDCDTYNFVIVEEWSIYCIQM